MATSEPSPYPPTEGEKARYYYGLSSFPSLVARTSTNNLTSTEWTPMPPWVKQFRPILKHDIVSAWSGELEQGIIKALDGCDWRFFYPVRIQDKEMSGTFPDGTDSAVILLVGVNARHLTWDLAIERALACRRVLQQAGINDVEVEVMDAITMLQASFRRNFEAKVNQQHWTLDRRREKPPPAARINAAVLKLHSTLGYPVVASHDGQENNIKGTMGLYLSLGSESKVYGLISHHAAFGEGGPEVTRVITHGTKGDLQIAYPMSSLTDSLEEVETTPDHVRSSMEYYVDKIDDNRGTPDDEATLSDLMSLLRYAYEFAQDLKIALHPPGLSIEERILGHVAFSPPRDFHPRNRQLRDWALVELDKSQFHGDLVNKVYVGACAGVGIATKMIPDPDVSLKPEDTGFLSLQGLRPTSESEKRSFRVAKRGQTSGLRFGVTNEIKANIRTPRENANDVISQALIVFGFVAESSGHNEFSLEGDSGSCVFDLDGRIVGMLDSGHTARDLAEFRSSQDPAFHNNNKWKNRYDFWGAGEVDGSQGFVDASFVTPMEWVLEDIREFTGQEPKIL